MTLHKPLRALSGALLISTLLGHVVPSGLAADKSATPDHAAPHWRYDGAQGPQHWGDLEPGFRTCATGRQQSPIDIPGGDTVPLTPIRFHYEATPLAIVHNGHTVQVNYAPGSHMDLDGTRYHLLQFHFHSPSEHTLAGQPAPMEVHFVHRSDAGGLAVIGVLFDVGGRNAALQEIWNFMPREQAPEHRYDKLMVNARDLLPDTLTHVRYAGSLTTPPCSEGVRWHVMDQHLTASRAQIDRFLEAVSPNARPPQAVNGRTLLRAAR